MKNYLIILLSGMLCITCVKRPDNFDQTLSKRIEHLATTVEYSIPVKEGYVTQVYLDGVNIANAVEPMNIMIPAYSSDAVSKSNSEPSLVYTEYSQYHNTLENKSRLFQVICFEDSVNGDYDYNDLVIHVMYQTQGNKFGFAIHPIALGSSKSIQLGCVVYKGDTQIYKGLITQDGNSCRSQYFQDQQGMINTETGNFYPDGKNILGWHQYLGSTMKCWDVSKVEGKGAMRVEWYISVDNGMELFALSTKYLSQSFDKYNYPYGIIITNTGCEYSYNNQPCGYDWFNYPKEKIHIKDVYPQMWNWLTTDASYNFSDIYSKNVVEGAFNATGLGLFEVTSVDVCKDQFLVN